MTAGWRGHDTVSAMETAIDVADWLGLKKTLSAPQPHLSWPGMGFHLRVKLRSLFPMSMKFPASKYTLRFHCVICVCMYLYREREKERGMKQCFKGGSCFVCHTCRHGLHPDNRFALLHWLMVLCVQKCRNVERWRDFRPLTMCNMSTQCQSTLYHVTSDHRKHNMTTLRLYMYVYVYMTIHVYGAQFVEVFFDA